MADFDQQYSYFRLLRDLALVSPGLGAEGQRYYYLSLAEGRIGHLVVTAFVLSGELLSAEPS